eukprot:3266164-Pyramimonas_sp.AAC.1
MEELGHPVRVQLEGRVRLHAGELLVAHLDARACHQQEEGLLAFAFMPGSFLLPISMPVPVESKGGQTLVARVAHPL